MIRKLLEWILGIDFSLCKHDFVLQKEIGRLKHDSCGLINHESFGVINDIPYKITFFYLCKKCGKQKIIEIK